MSKAKSYIGDGVYAEIDEFDSVTLTTENGIRTTNRIVLERETLASLLSYCRHGAGESMAHVVGRTE